MIKQTKVNCCVYWLSTKEFSNPYSEGYVGVTTDLDNRVMQHWFSTKSKTRKYFEQYGRSNIIVTVLFEGTAEQCYAKEAELRPQMYIGWNIQIGGKLPYVFDCTGRKHSESTKAKIALSNKGKIGTPNKFKGVTNRYTDEQKKHIGSFHKGKTISEEQKAKCKAFGESEDNPKARYLTLEHKDSVGTFIKYHSIRVASEATGVSRSAFKSTIANHRTTYNRKGYRVVYELSHPKLGQK